MQKQKYNLLGVRFGHLLVVGRSEDKIYSNGEHETRWICKCDCGKTITLLRRNLTQSNKTHCGCLTENNKDLRFYSHMENGKRIIDKYPEKWEEGFKKWANKEFDMRGLGEFVQVGQNLLAEMMYTYIESNPELRNEIVPDIYYRKRNKMTANHYDLSGEYGIGYDYNNNVFIFDLEDYDIVSKYSWFVDNGYVKTSIVKEDGSLFSLFLHRLLMCEDIHEDIFIDHINHKTWDDRKNNLRKVTPGENMMNRKTTKNNPYNVNGITFKDGKWCAKIGYRHKEIKLGRFSTKEEAIAARKQAEEKYYGEFAYKGDSDAKLS